MKKLPIGIQTFRDIIEDNYYYVDKTPYIKELKENGKVYFLSRPRRFGKSLLISTIKEAFSGERELFKGLYLYDNWDWTKRHPVIHISFGTGEFQEKEGLRIRIEELLYKHQKKYDIELRSKNISGRFEELIESLYTKYGQKVVVLVDEYDKPILDVIENKKMAKQNRDILKAFYTVLKDADPYLEFVFITGVSKFSKVSIFSGLNQLNDITLDFRYSAICGYREEDLQTVFFDRIGDFNIEDIRIWYNGYSWLGEKVYNPFDVLLLFSKKDFRPYWFETGTPTFLIKLLFDKNYYIPELEHLEITDLILESFDVDNITIENLLFQTGYLTIQERRKLLNRNIYIMSYPNLEVKTSLNEKILALLSDNTKTYGVALIESLLNNNFNKLKEIIISFFASIPYYWNDKVSKYEGFYASCVYSLFASTGFNLIAEDITNKGRIDLTILYKERIYIIEFKVIDKSKTKEENNKFNKALKQIKEKKYYEKYMIDRSHIYKEIYLIGMEFDKSERNIVGFDVERIK